MNTKTTTSAQLLKPPHPPASPSPSGRRKIKESIRKMPSSLFAHGGGAGSRSHHSTTARAPSPASSHSPTPTLNNPVAPPAPPKQQKPRKGLGNIFNWGGSKAKHTNAAATPPLPPSKPPATTDTRSTRTAWPRRQPSGNTLVVPENKQRPSCGPDPFVRPGQGAAIVAFPPIERSTSAKEIEAERHAPSIKAVAAKDDFEDSWVEDSMHFHVPPEVVSSTSREDRRVSAPLLTSVPATSLSVPAPSVAPRSATLGPSFNIGGLADVPPPTFASRPTTPSQAETKHTKTLKKDKTRSTVWGFFKNRKPKHKGGVVATDPEVPPVPSPPKAERVPVPQNIAAQASVPAPRPTSTTPVPTLHITHPSVDMATIGIPIRPRPRSPSVSPRLQQLPIVDDDFTFVTGQSRSGGQGSLFAPQAAEVQRPAEASSTKSLPKRKSLTGLFSIALRKSIDKMRTSPSSSPKKRVQPPPSLLRLQSVSETKEGNKGDVVTSRFGDAAFRPNTPYTQTDAASLQEVTSATVELFDFVTNMPPSLTGSPVAKGTRASVQSLRQASQTSPLPLRKVKSAAIMLLSRGSPSRKAEAKPTATSPTVPQPAVEKNILTPIRSNNLTPTSMIKAGQRNIFAPPSPVNSPIISVQRRAMYLDLTEEVRSRISCYSTGSGASDDIIRQLTPVKDIRNITAHSDQFALDVPRNLRGDVYEVSDSPAPPMPPSHGHYTFGTPREAVAQEEEEGQLDFSSPTRRVSTVAPRLQSMDLGGPIQRSPPLSELLSPNSDDITGGSFGSFDFTARHDELSKGDERASFMEAVHKSKTSSPSADFKIFTSPKYLAPIPFAVAPRQLTPQSGEEVSRRDANTEWFGPLPPLPPLPSPTARVRASPVPFKGRPEFQMSFGQPTATTREVQTQTSGLFPPPPFDLPKPPRVSRPQGTQHKPASSAAFSIASISSLGAPIDGVTREYTNYFEKNFDANDKVPPVPPLPASLLALPTESSSRQRRLSSSSLSSSVVEDVSSVHAVTARTGLRQPSASVGRSYGAGHRRNQSSGDSLSRIGRPGLGERMFQSDKAVLLTAISGSPSESLDEQRSRALHDGDINRLSEISTDSSQDSATSVTEVFGNTVGRQSSGAFSLKARPLSDSSTGSDEIDGANDTLDDIRVSTPSKVGYYAGVGEGTPTPHSTTNNEGRLMLSATHGRPPKPRGSRQSRVRMLDLRQSRDSTPSLGCSSASASDSISIRSFRSNPSNPPEMVSRFPVPQQTSMFWGFKAEPTIREVPSMATVRPTSPQNHDADVVGQWEVEDVRETIATRSFIDVHREAEYEIQANKTQWVDNDEVNAADGSFEAPKTEAEFLAFLAKSKRDFKPLKELPLGHTIRRRRTSSMEARGAIAAYGNTDSAPHGSIFIPPPVTRFQHKKGSTGSTISTTQTSTSSCDSFGDGDSVIPVSPLIAEFAREQAPLAKVVTAPSSTLQAPSAHLSNLQVPSSSSRARVNSTERRNNLGWGRRRHSDGPEQLLIPAASELVPAPKSASAATFPTHRVPPSFIAFSPHPPDIRKQNEESLKAAATTRASERPVPTVRMPPPRPPRREVALHVSSCGSPVNLNSLESGPTQALCIPKRHQRSDEKDSNSRKVLASTKPNVVLNKTSRGALKGQGDYAYVSKAGGGVPALPIWSQPLPALPSPSRARTHSKAKDSMHLRQASRNPAAPLRI